MDMNTAMWIVPAINRQTGMLFATFCFETWDEANAFWQARQKGFPGNVWLHLRYVTDEGEFMDASCGK